MAHTGALPQHLDAAGAALEFPGEVFRVGQHEWMVCGRHNAAACPVCTAASGERTASPHAGEDSLHLPQHSHHGGGAAPASSPHAAPASPPLRPGDVAPASSPTSPPRARTPASRPPASPRARTPASPPPAFPRARTPASPPPDSPRARTPATPPPDSPRARTPTTTPRSRRRRPCDFASSPASPPRPRRRYAARTGRGCGGARTSTPADADESELAGGAGKKAAAAAADVYMARAERGRWMDRFMVTIALGPRFWAQEFLDWVYVMRGSPRYRLRDEWTWIGVMGRPIKQHDCSSVISSVLVCLGARHRLDFERRHGFNTFPFHIPAGTVQFFKKRCKQRHVWNREDGTNGRGVLEVIQQAGGATAARSVPGWKFCKLQVKDFEYHYCPAMPPSEIASLIYTEGPLLGTLIIGTDYYDDGWEHRVYRGAPIGQEDGDHTVVCFGYRYDTTGQPHGVPELQIEAMDNHQPHGPVRWIAAEAFSVFFEVQVEPLDVDDLQLNKTTPWWRRLLSTVRGTFTWIFRR